MEFINTTFAHGNGPYSRNVDLSLAVNEEFRKRRMNTLPIVVPLVYGDRQKRIMLEDFGDIIKKNPELILLDEFHGEVLRGLLFHEGTYQENLEAFLERYNSAGFGADADINSSSTGPDGLWGGGAACRTNGGTASNEANPCTTADSSDCVYDQGQK